MERFWDKRACRQIKIRVFKRKFFSRDKARWPFLMEWHKSFESFVSLDNERSVWGCETFCKCILLCPLSSVARGCTTLFARDLCIFLSLRRIKRFSRNLFWLSFRRLPFPTDKAIFRETVYSRSILPKETLIEHSWNNPFSFQFLCKLILISLASSF